LEFEKIFTVYDENWNTTLGWLEWPN
jgi:hypothetical protein